MTDKSSSNQYIEAGIMEGLAALRIPSDNTLLSLLTAYLAELERWNTRFGFIKADPKELIQLHLLDALSGIFLLQSYVPAGVILDFGSGAGFPGLPLGICLPDRQFILCERKNTERVFLENIILTLKLPNLSVIEDIKNQKKDSLTAVVFRAVTSLKKIYSIVQPYLAPGGLLLAYKGTRNKIDKEIEEFEEKGLQFKVHPVRLPGVARERHLVTIRME